jgi:hypothetical protein
VTESAVRYLVIDIEFSREPCWACRMRESDPLMGIPVYEDLVLPNDWPGEWGGVPACPECFNKQNALGEAVALSEFNRLQLVD